MNFKPLLSFAFTFFFSVSIPAASTAQLPLNTYDKQWKQVDDLITKQLSRSALVKVRSIYRQAKKNKDDVQSIKALIYMTGLQSDLLESGEEAAIADIEKEIPSVTEPAKSILNSLLAGTYWNYYQRHRWQLYSRTNTEGFKKNDISTWTVDDLNRRISELYLKSIEHSPLLQHTRLEPFDAIIIKGNMRHLRPTLFDLLAHRALEYFKSDERDISRPAYAFEILEPSAFDPASDFIHRKFQTNDSFSLQHKALLLYQQLLAFHLDDQDPDAMIDADIERLEFVNEKGVQENKKELYLLALNHITHQYEGIPAASQARYLVARQLSEDAATYAPYGDTSHRYDRIRAKDICEKVLLEKDSSEGKDNCYNLLLKLNQKDLKFAVEKVNMPGQPFRVLVQYRNISQLYLRLVKPDEAIKNELDNSNDKRIWSAMISLTPFRNWDQQLPETNDMQEHAAEIKIDALPAGEYLLVMSSDKDFDATQSILAARLFYVSTISYVNSGQSYFVMNRGTGQPLRNALVQLWERKYDYKTSRYTKEKSLTYNTDDKGFFHLERKQDKSPVYDYTYLVDIKYGDERLFMNDYQYDYYYNGEVQTTPENAAVFLFTDRSIYRPGQTVFFKGIAINKEWHTRNNTVKAGYETMVYLTDANEQSIDSLKVKTNDYGSFSGKFQLPQTGLNGEFSLSMKNDEGSTNISVEDYKRPKFRVDFDKSKQMFKVNDSIAITGVAKAYSGNNIDQATVIYRIVRRPRLIYEWVSWRSWQPYAKEMEIGHGKTGTDKNGKFEIEFKAIPDQTIDRKFDPVFDFVIYVEITDISGETRSGESTISIGYKSLLLHLDLPDKLPVDSFRNISLRTTNMAGEFEPAKATVSIYKLREEPRLIRPRYWQRPDLFAISQEEYIKLFPHDEYDNETDYNNWTRDGNVIDEVDSTREDSDFPLRTGLKPGFYEIEVVTADKEGQEIKDRRFIELYDEKAGHLAKSQYLWVEGSKPIEPGQQATITIGTSAESLFVIQQIDRFSFESSQPRINFSVVGLGNEKRSFHFAAADTDRGGYGVSFFFVKENRLYQFNDIIRVPWTNKDLNIEYATFRDKTLPGSEEKWKVRITGDKGEKVAAEMLAGMYDVSLDQFKTHNWDEPQIWPEYSIHSTWNGTYNFSKIESQEKEIEQSVEKYIYKNYDALLVGIVEQLRPRLAKPTRASNARALEMNKAPSVALQGKVSGLVIVKDEEIAADTTRRGQIHQEGKAPAMQIRKNFNETAFFFPDLHTDSAGAIEFSFTIPEALTAWKLQTLAHTKDLAFGLSTKEVITQKQLMVQANFPRFLREGDRMEIAAKIVNLTDSEFTGQAQLQLIDPTSTQSVDGWFQNMFPNQYFTVAAGQSEVVKFPIQVPYLFNRALEWRIVARTTPRSPEQPGWSDGEEDAIPVVTNKVMVTETLPLNMKGTGTRNFKLEKLLNTSQASGAYSESLQNYSLTAEYTSNPAWSAVQSLPYLIDYPYECAEQTWNRYFANALASIIANSAPRIKEIFQQWKLKDTSALLSNLEKNQELKSVLLEETPWVLEAKSEDQQRKNIALLFDVLNMSSGLSNSLNKLIQLQSENGGFVWFNGGADDRYITQYIVTGIGHLLKLSQHCNVPNEQQPKLEQILQAAIPYLDRKINDDYREILTQKQGQHSHSGDELNSLEIQYLYMRSFFLKYPVPKTSLTAYNYFRKQTQTLWTRQDKYMQGMIALALFRTGDPKTAGEILRSLKETAIVTEDLGMYWKQSNPGWFWYQAPVETQSLLIETFSEIHGDTRTIDDMKTWLLRNRQTTHWSTTKATAEACYALLFQGSQWLSVQPAIRIKLGNSVFANDSAEAGTGYFKKVIEGDKVRPEMGNISITVGPGPHTNDQNLVSWGSITWQYLEEADKISASSTPLKLSKKLFIEKNTDRGLVLAAVNENDELHIGDKVRVRIELRVDRDMEYIHMKDMRASGLEPVNVLSEYKWQDGLGYYESTKDASTNFFFNYLPKGTYVFEYPLFASQTGNFSNGITTIQCMYAPEFTSHSEGIRISVVD